MYLPCIHPDHQHQHQVDRYAWTGRVRITARSAYSAWVEGHSCCGSAPLAVASPQIRFPAAAQATQTSSWPRALVKTTTQSHAAGLCLHGVCAGPASSGPCEVATELATELTALGSAAHTVAPGALHKREHTATSTPRTSRPAHRQHPLTGRVSVARHKAYTWSKCWAACHT
jgi:hypothetical protein